jgi:hypothetical protein
VRTAAAAVVEAMAGAAEGTEAAVEEEDTVGVAEGTEAAVKATVEVTG